MRTIFWIQGIIFRVNLRETEPAHIHCNRGDCSARYSLVEMAWLDCNGFTRSDLRKMEERIKARIEECWAEWERLYGEEK